jgi:hypothetical protein
LAGKQHIDQPKALGFLTTKEQGENLNTFLKIIYIFIYIGPQGHDIMVYNDFLVEVGLRPQNAI